MMPLATVKLENIFMDNEDMFKSLFLLQLHKNICFELSFLTFIPVLYTKTGCSIGLGVNICYQNNHDVPISMVMHLQISGNIYIIVIICGNKTDNCPWHLMDSPLMELWSFCTTLSSLKLCTEFRFKNNIDVNNKCK